MSLKRGPRYPACALIRIFIRRLTFLPIFGNLDRVFIVVFLSHGPGGSADAVARRPLAATEPGSRASPTQPTDAWKAAAEAASKPQVAIPAVAYSPLPVAPPVLTPQAQKNVPER